MKNMEEKLSKQATPEEDGKKQFVAPVLTKYGTVKDVYRGPSCKSVLANAEDK